jgi:histidine kinase/DNA gyrase B/HSP90-like ATPase
MQAFENTSLWQGSLGDAAFTHDVEARNRLRERLLDMRSRASHLVSLIPRDMPGLTVHDVSHLDALWETASLIAGPLYPLNPAEAFVFGAAILLHDSAMSLAAYPGGLSEIKATPEWRDAVAYHLRAAGTEITPALIDSASTEISRAALADVLRDFHARRAGELPFVEWPSPDGTRESLMQDSDLRNAYGHIIGQIAASHWWPTSELRKLPQRVNAGPGVPMDWHVSPLKLACLLRVADAAHVDHRRAPRFLRALIQPEGASAAHWAFQTHLGKPSIDKTFLVYTGSPFDIEEAGAWWLCYDMLAMIDDELRSAHSLLDASDIPSFAATAVKNAKSPEAVAALITTRRWKPVDTELRVSDVPALVKLLGGERLYGADPAVPLRELIQNAADAIRARRLLANLEPTAGKITVQLRKDKHGAAWIDVEDDGIGMSSNVLTGALLDFGKSFWGSAAMRREFPGLQSKGLKPTGRFGIGFFSVFMLGDEVTVTSRRHDAAASDTHTLDFRKGLRMRPILREPVSEEALVNPGTRVSVRLRIPPDEPLGLLYRGMSGSTKSLIELRTLVARHSPAVDVTVSVIQGGSTQVAIAANDWLSEEPKTLLNRTAGDRTDWVERSVAFMTANLRELKDSLTGQSHGRACICPTSSSYYSAEGVITVGGFLAAKVQHIVGVLNGEPRTVSRDSAQPTVPSAVLREWATEQGKLIAVAKISGEQKLHAAEIVMLLGGTAPELPIVIQDGEYLEAEALEKLLLTLAEVEVYMGKELDYDDDDDVRPKDFSADLSVSSGLIFVSKRGPTILRLGDLSWPECLSDIYPINHIKTCEDAFHRALETAWGSLPEYDEDKRTVGEVHGTEIVRYVRIYVRPIDMSHYLDEPVPPGDGSSV